MIDKIKDLLKKSNKISDFHLRSGHDLAYREMGDIFIQKNVKILEKDIEDLLKSSCSKEEIELFRKKKELDSAIQIDGIRFRSNFYITLKGLAVVMRKIDSSIPSMDSLSLPSIMYDLAESKKGLVLVTGPTGSGKSTTLAAIINYINEKNLKDRPFWESQNHFLGPCFTKSLHHFIFHGCIFKRKIKDSNLKTIT